MSWTFRESVVCMDVTMCEDICECVRVFAIDDFESDSDFADESPDSKSATGVDLFFSLKEGPFISSAVPSDDFRKTSFKEDSPSGLLFGV